MPRNVVVTDRDLQKIAVEYDRGTSIRTLADLRGWSYGYMHARLREAQAKGLTVIRGRGGFRRPRA